MNKTVWWAGYFFIVAMAVWTVPMVVKLDHAAGAMSAGGFVVIASTWTLIGSRHGGIS